MTMLYLSMVIDFHYFCCKPSKMLSFSSITIILVVSLFVKLWIVNGHLIILFFFFFIKQYLGVVIVCGDLFIIGERFIFISVVDVICVIWNSIFYLLLGSWMSFNFWRYVWSRLDEILAMVDLFWRWFRWRFRCCLRFFYFVFQFIGDFLNFLFVITFSPISVFKPKLNMQ